MKLTKTQKEQIKKIAEKYSLRMLLLFGSQPLKKIHKESDFDIAYLSRKKLDLEKETKLILDLSPILKSENIDLVDLKKAPPLLFYAVFQRPKVLFQEDNLIFPTYQTYAFKKYIETKPLYEYKFQKLQKNLI